MSRLRHRRRVARLIVRAHTTRRAVGRELRWLARDVRDLRVELHRYVSRRRTNHTLWPALIRLAGQPRSPDFDLEPRREAHDGR